MPTTQFATRPAGAKAHPKRTRALIQIRDLDGATALDALRQRALDERVDVAVEHAPAGSLLWVPVRRSFTSW